jgi:hypothetical protein
VHHVTVSAPAQPEWSVDRQPVLLRWQPDRADYIEAFALRARQRRTRPTFALIFGLLAVMLVAGVIGQQATLIGAGSGGIVALGLLLLMQPLMVRRFWSHSTALQQPVQAHLSPAGIDSRTALSAGQWPWTSVHSVLEGERCYVVQMHGYRGKAFLPLAKRGASDPPAQAALRAWLGPYLNVPR